MATSIHSRPDDSPEFAYLCVDHFLQGLVESRALATAFELGLFDYIGADQTRSVDCLGKQIKNEGPGLRLLLELLKANKVVEETNGGIRLTRQFSMALRFRDLLEAKLDLAGYAANDFLNLFSFFINRPDEFIRRASMFKLFNYAKCSDPIPENYEQTKRWMRITTALTRYEAPVCMKYHDFSPYRRMLDIGGNSGEFALQICKRYPKIQATVFDLPLVCDLGKEHVRQEPEANRINFVKGNALEDAIPTGFDLITFKSVLHDWPEKIATQFIIRASHALEPEGTMLIFERGSIELGDVKLPYSMIPFLLFSHSFRSPAMYTQDLQELGYRNIRVQKIDLEMPFHLVSAVKMISCPPEP